MSNVYFDSIYMNSFLVLLPEIFLIISITVALFLIFIYKNKLSNLALTNLIFKSNYISFFFIAVALILNPVLYHNVFFDNFEIIRLFQVGPFEIFSKFLIIILGVFILFISQTYFLDEEGINYEFPIFFNIALLGSFLVLSAYDLFILFYGFELQALIFYVMASYRRYSSESIRSSLNYFIYGAFFSCFFLFGICLVYGSLGMTDFFAIRSSIGFLVFHKIVTPQLVIGFVMIFLAILFKLGMVPAHFWLGDVYTGSPMPVVAFFSIIPKFVSIIAAIKLLLCFSPLSLYFADFFALVCVVTIIVGSVLALYEFRIRRFIAYSAISNIGFLMAPVAFFDLHSWAVVIEYFFIYSVLTLNLFSVLLFFRNAGQANQVWNINQLGVLLWNHKTMAFVFITNLFSMAGIPPLGGGIVKLLVVDIFVSQGNMTLALLMFLAGILSLVVYLRFIRICIFEQNENFKNFFNSVKENSPFALRLVIFLTFMINVFFCLFFQNFDSYVLKALTVLLKYYFS